MKKIELNRIRGLMIEDAAYLIDVGGIDPITGKCGQFVAGLGLVLKDTTTGRVKTIAIDGTILKDRGKNPLPSIDVRSYDEYVSFPELEEMF